MTNTMISIIFQSIYKTVQQNIKQQIMLAWEISFGKQDTAELFTFISFYSINAVAVFSVFEPTVSQEPTEVAERPSVCLTPVWDYSNNSFMPVLHHDHPRTSVLSPFSFVLISVRRPSALGPRGRYVVHNES